MNSFSRRSIATIAQCIKFFLKIRNSLVSVSFLAPVIDVRCSRGAELGELAGLLVLEGIQSKPAHCHVPAECDFECCQLKDKLDESGFGQWRPRPLSFQTQGLLERTWNPQLMGPQQWNSNRGLVS